MLSFPQLLKLQHQADLHLGHNRTQNQQNDLDIDMERVIFSEFEAGHMMYNHQPSFDRFLKEVNNFLKE